ncbi:hypothetical protein ACGFX7_05655 [Streptomyces harbinensis]|uniref:hypothetical protein n=1 Tax=Streptomyces harbinensis TaxID=1176198 RepID=UPI00371BAD99
MSTQHALNRALAGTAVALLLTGGLAAAPAFASGDDVPPSAAAIAAIDKGGAGQGAPAEFSTFAVGPQITRTEVINRAANWVGRGLQYSWTNTYQGYRTDCSGYVSMAWKLGTPGLDTTSFVPRGYASWISKDALKPGDALLNDAAGASGHIVLFAGWTDASKSAYRGYEFTGSGVHYRTIPYPYYSGYGTFRPVRNNSIVDDVTPPAPVDPGPDNVGIYRPSTSEFHLRKDDGSLLKIKWGTTGDIPVSGNWDGGHLENVGIYRPSTSTFHLRKDDGGLIELKYGTTGDIPISGDWDGGHAGNVGIYRPSTNEFHLRMDDGKTRVIKYGTTGDIPITGNWDGGHASNIGIYRPSTNEFHLRMDDGKTRVIKYGTTGDKPVSANWDGGHAGNIGIYRPSTNEFHLRMDDGKTRVIKWGTTGDIPVAGNWDARG